jgi:hypothetical protein
MSAVPIYVWNGTAWQETGPTIPASPIKYQASAPSSPSTGDIWVDSDADVTTGSQQFQRFRFVASGGETTESGADANGAVLAYTPGAELVVLNGSTLVRGQDYTATDGTTISGLSPALVANDVLEVFSFIAFSVANTYTQSQVDGLLADYAGLRLLVPTSAVNGTVGATGAVTFSAVSSVSLNGCFTSTYDNYEIVFNIVSTNDADVKFRWRVGGADNSSANYSWTQAGTFASTSGFSGGQTNNDTSARFATSNAASSQKFGKYTFFNPFATATSGYSGTQTYSSGTANYNGSVMGLGFNGTTSFDGFTLFPAAGTITGTIRVYGYKN